MPRGAESDREKIELNEVKINPVQLKSLLEEQIEKILILRNTIYKGKSEKSKPIKMLKEEEIKFQVFDGRDYNIWGKKNIIVFKMEKL